MPRFPRVLWLLVAALILAVPAAAFDFAGERLVYEFGWQKISAATVEVRVDAAQVAGSPGYAVEMKVTGKPKLDWIWRVRDKVTAKVIGDSLQTVDYLFEQREASFFLDTRITFDPDADKLLGTRMRLLEKGATKELAPNEAPGDYHTPISALMLVRRASKQVGQKIFLNVFDGKRQHQMVYEVIGEEPVKIGLGTFDAWKIQPKLLRSTGSSNADKVRDVFIWVDKNPPHHVLRIESEVFVGHVYAELVKK